MNITKNQIPVLRFDVTLPEWEDELVWNNKEISYTDKMDCAGLFCASMLELKFCVLDMDTFGKDVREVRR